MPRGVYKLFAQISPCRLLTALVTFVIFFRSAFIPLYLSATGTASDHGFVGAEPLATREETTAFRWGDCFSVQTTREGDKGLPASLFS